MLQRALGSQRTRQAFVAITDDQRAVQAFVKSCNGLSYGAFRGCARPLLQRFGVVRGPASPSCNTLGRSADMQGLLNTMQRSELSGVQRIRQPL
jgi:hypothetical protein